jgi:hypothetical protein
MILRARVARVPCERRRVEGSYGEIACVECESADVGRGEATIEEGAGEDCAVPFEINEATNVSRSCKRHACRVPRSDDVSVVGVEASEDVPVWEGDVGVSTKPTVLMRQSIRNLNMDEKSDNKPEDSSEWCETACS